jgi:hypothetical protein
MNLKNQLHHRKAMPQKFSKEQLAIQVDYSTSAVTALAFFFHDLYE